MGQFSSSRIIKFNLIPPLRKNIKTVLRFQKQTTTTVVANDLAGDHQRWDTECSAKVSLNAKAARAVKGTRPPLLGTPLTSHLAGAAFPQKHRHFQLPTPCSTPYKQELRGAPGSKWTEDLPTTHPEGSGLSAIITQASVLQPGLCPSALAKEPGIAVRCYGR